MSRPKIFATKQAYQAFWYQQNRDRILISTAKRAKERKVEIAAWHKQYYLKNKERISLYKRTWKRKNKKRISEKHKLRQKTDLAYHLACRLRSRTSLALKNNYKIGSAVKDLGCTVAELKTHLESKFIAGMSWDNYGLYGWHIDHVKPLKSFNLEDRDQFLEACNYKNLQPLWWHDNLSKGTTLDIKK